MRAPLSITVTLLPPCCPADLPPLQARLAGGPLRLDLQDLFRSHSLDTVGLVSLRARLDTLRRSGQVAEGAERVAGGLWGYGLWAVQGCGLWRRQLRGVRMLTRSGQVAEGTQRVAGGRVGGLWGCGCNGALAGCWPACGTGGLVHVAEAPHAW